MLSSSGPEPPRRHLERSRRVPEASQEHPLEPQERPRRPNWVPGGSQKHLRAIKTETKTRQDRVSDGKCRFSEKYAFSQEKPYIFMSAGTKISPKSCPDTLPNQLRRRFATKVVRRDALERPHGGSDSPRDAQRTSKMPPRSPKSRQGDFCPPQVLILCETDWMLA